MLIKHSQKRTFMDIEKMSSNEFKAFCRSGNQNHFTRIRKMPLQDLLFTMINRKGLTLALELRNYMKIAHPGTFISKPGYLKQRMKLNPDVFLAVALACTMTFSMATITHAADAKEITIGVTSFADTLEPTEQYFSWVVSRYAIGECLTKFDEEGEIVPCLAESWENSEDGKTWTFKIREGVKFSNGDDMTPEMVMASIQRTVDKSDRVPEFFDLDSMEVDGQNLIFHLNRANANMAGSLADPLFLIVDTNVDDSIFAMEGPICTGPYKVESFSPTDSCVVTKNENYWDGAVPLDKVTLKCVDDQTTRSMALQTGEIDIAYNLKTENLIEFEGNDNYEIQELQSLRSTYAFMNQSEGRALSDKALRQALLRGLDKQTYCDVLLEGGATAGKAPVPPTLDFGFDDLNDENSYDPEGAKAILEEAGYKDTDGDGFVETPDGDPLTLDFVIYTSRAELGVYAQAAQASLKEIAPGHAVACFYVEEQKI